MVTVEEIENALFAIGPTKAPGPDGFPALFFHKCWTICKDDITKRVLQCFTSGEIPDHLNETLITLPWCLPCPQSMVQLRPISSFRTLYIRSSLKSL